MTLRGQVLAMAHRGGGGQWPQNTLYAFERAVALGMDALELDIHATADKVLVVLHDETVEQTTDGCGPVRQLTLAEFKALDAGYQWTADGGKTFPFRGQGITHPTLEELLQAFPAMRLNIDIKQAVPSIVERFVDLLGRYNALERVTVGSFHDRELAKFRTLCPQVGTAAGVSETRLFYLLVRVGLARFYHPNVFAFQVPEWAGRQHVVTPAFIRDAHRHGIEVHVWTVDEITDMQRLISWGVDGLISDYPSRLMEVLGR